MLVECPVCKKDVEWSTKAQYRPFCSQKCKMIDLGHWSEESYVLPVSAADESSDEDEDLH